MPVFALKKFEELKRKEIHDIYALRAAIFVVEQDCVYQDIDGKDLEAHAEPAPGDLIGSVDRSSCTS